MDEVPSLREGRGGGQGGVEGQREAAESEVAAVLHVNVHQALSRFAGAVLAYQLLTRRGPFPSARSHDSGLCLRSPPSPFAQPSCCATFMSPPPLCVPHHRSFSPRLALAGPHHASLGACTYAFMHDLSRPSVELLTP